MGQTNTPFHTIALAVSLALAGVAPARAGDILRGGAPAASTVNAPSATSGTTTAQAAKAQANAADALARTTAAINSVRSMQAAARKAAIAGSNNLGKNPNFPGQILPNVPNGLVIGGLQVAPGVPVNLTAPAPGENANLWTGAKLPTQTFSGGKTKVTIVQTQSQALLNWQTFNVGKQTSVTFHQKAGKADASKWIAFNLINDPSGNPTQILGSINAIGQVYLINTNGILFGGSSTVNLHNLTASSLPINQNLISGGLLNQTARNVQFLFSAKTTDPAFTLSSGSTQTLTKPVASGTTPVVSYNNGTTQNTLQPGDDYTLQNNSDGKTQLDFTTSGLAKVGSSFISASYTQATGDLIVQPGALLTSPTTPSKVGGRVNLIAPNVSNQGTLSAADGQVILAAGREVGFFAHSQADASLRGLDVFVGSVDSQSGNAANSGLIDISRGNATIAGKHVAQLGVISSTTSVSLNGSVDLQANYNAQPNPSYDPTNVSLGSAFGFSSSGVVTLGEKSVTRIVPEYESAETVVGTQLALPSRLKFQGLAIHLAPDSFVFAPNADATLTAGSWNYIPPQSTTTRLTADFVNTNGQVYIDSGASIDVAGSAAVFVSVTQNILNLQLRGAELADSPVQRDGVLRAISLNLDIRNRGEYNGAAWIGTPLGDATGFAGLIQRGVGQLTAAGGNVSIRAGSSVVLQPGSRVDSSGGYIQFESGTVETSRVLSGGQLYDISQATPDRVYQGIYTGQSTFFAEKYGITEIYNNPLAMMTTHYETGYIQGASGGKISITSPSMAIDGELVGQTVASSYQRSTPPAYSELLLTFEAQQLIPGYPGFSPRPPTIFFSDSASLRTADPFRLDAFGNPLALRPDRQKMVVLSPELFTTDGFGKFSIRNTDGDVIVPEGIDFHGPASGKLLFEAANILIGSDISTAGGALGFISYNISPAVAATLDTTTPAAAPDRGLFTLASHITLSTAGLVIDERNPENLKSLLAINGGSISVNSFSANFAIGSLLNVSGGLTVSPTGKRNYGTAGSIGILTGRDPNANAASVIGGKLFLGGSLQGYDSGKGGSLSIQSQFIQIGGALAPSDTFWIQPEFFNTGGFSNFSLNGIGGKNGTSGQYRPALTVAENTLITPNVKTWLSFINVLGTDGVVLSPILQPEGLRPSASISLNANATSTLDGLLLSRGDLVVGRGSLLEAGPLGTVSLKGGTVTVLGSIIAPGGKINLSANGTYPQSGTDAAPTTALPTLWLAPGSLLSTAGKLLLTPDAYGRRTGSVIDGGAISVSGNIIADHGATLDVSGASGLLDLALSSVDYTATQTGESSSATNIPTNSGINAPLRTLQTVATRIDSNAGSITFAGSRELFIDATLHGSAGGPTAQGGSLSISSGRFYSLSDLLPTPRDISLIVTQSESTRPVVDYQNGQSPLGIAVLGQDNAPIAGLGYFSVETFANSGMDSLALQGNVRFLGNVSILARRELSVATKGVFQADGQVSLTAAHASLGTAFGLPVAVNSEIAPYIDPLTNGPYYIPPTYGPGSLTVTASLIDIGNLTLQGIGQTTLIANHGDVRGTGTFDFSGDLVIRSGQVYPTTAGHFTIAGYDKTILVGSSNQGNTAVTLASAILPPDFAVGSDLLGSTVSAISGNLVTLANGANASVNNSTQTFARGSITFARLGSSVIPYSAGGQLDIYASVIHQGGVLRAPLGVINLGRDGTAGNRLDLVAGTNVPVSEILTLDEGSITSVSADGLRLPYGYSSNGTTFIDPTGNDIASSQVPSKNITLGGKNIAIARGSALDIRGGGEFFAYRFIKGNGGSTDLLGWNFQGTWNTSQLYKESSIVSYNGSFWYARADLTSDVAAQPPIAGDYWKRVTQRFAVIPTYSENFAPYAPFNSTTDPGYATTGLNVGDRVWLGASESLKAGVYTLLPARYALLPGAVLVTPRSGTSAFDYSTSLFDGATQTIRQVGQTVGTFALTDGSRLVSGYRYNDSTSNREIQPVYTRFEVASRDVVQSRAAFDSFLANSFLSDSGQRLPNDAGHLILQASQSMTLQGRVYAQAANAFSRAGLVDIASTSEIYITDSPGSAPVSGVLTLDAKSLSSFGAESLLVGGVRTLTTDAGGITTANVNVITTRLSVDNARAPLSAPEIILVARENLTIAPDANIVQTGAIHGASDPLILGNSTPGSGDGVLLMVSSDRSAQITRQNYTSSSIPLLTIGSGATLRGGSVILDSTSGTAIDQQTRLLADAVTLDSGQISILLNDPGSLPAGNGLVLSGGLLESVKMAQALSLLSYSSIDTYGSGTFATAGNLTLHGGELRGFNNGGGQVTFRANAIALDNSPNAAHLTPATTTAATLEFDANTISIGKNQFYIDQFSSVSLNASQSLNVAGTGGLYAQNDLVATTPRITAGKAATQAIIAGGALLIQTPATTSVASTQISGLGASLTLQGASVLATSDIALPSGLLTLRATNGDLTIGGALDVGGTAQSLFDVVRYTNAGQIRLQADAGSVVVQDTASISVAGAKNGGNAGTLSVSAAQGKFDLTGKLIGTSIAQTASFTLDADSVTDFSALADVLALGGFTESQSFRLRTDSVELAGEFKVSHFNLSTDTGWIKVTGTLDASGITGGSISLISGNNLTIESGAVLTVHAKEFSHAGKGGEIHLEAGSAVNGVTNLAALLDLQTKSTIDLGVDQYVAGDSTNAASSAYQGKFTGKLLLRAPRSGDDILIASLGSAINGASAIVAEGYQIYDRADTGTLDSDLRTSINSAADNYISNGGAAMRAKLLAINLDAANLDRLLVLAPGVEIINGTGNLTLGTTSSTNTADWDLSAFRYDSTLLNGDVSRAPGILTLRAAGDIILFNAISDGFVSSAYNARLLAADTFTPINSQSWSYHITAGADLSAADFASVQQLASLGDATTSTIDDIGSLKLGKNAGNATVAGGASAQTSTALNNRFQVIRTGSGDITVTSGRSVQLLNQFANIYTTGTQIFDATLGGTFDLPIPSLRNNDVGSLGAVQQGIGVVNTAQYSFAGGDVSLHAQADIERTTLINGVLMANSEKQLPTNWLNRRSAIDPTTGLFTASRYGDIASTTWWIDFSNFFEGIGALGGGDVSLQAGGNVTNVDAVVPTNARMAGKDSAGKAISPSATNLLEIGGGDLLVRSGGDIDAGVYYVERGQGVLDAGGEVKTNQTRSPSLGNFAPTPDYYTESAWLPTTLFLGKGSFSVNARSNLLLGPVVNPFLLPQGFNNTFWYKTYFSTYATTNRVDIVSLGGSVTLRERISLPGNQAVNASIPILQAYYQNVLRFATANTVSILQPWLRLSETSVNPFTTVFSLMPSSLSATSFSGDVNLQGGFTASPSATGNIELFASGAINGLQPIGSTRIGSQQVNVWTSSTVNLSDANPSILLSPFDSFAYQNTLATPSSRAANQTSTNFLQFLDQYLAESGSDSGIYALNETKNALHGTSLLHKNDPNPVRLYANSGNISGLTLFSPKATRILARQDITDISFYLQNLADSDLSVVSAGRDLIAYNSASTLRIAATSSGNSIAGTIISTNTIPDSEAGDIQISGPGTLEVLAGRNLDLGAGSTRPNGTGSGILSIGNARNLNLPFEGASLVVGAGVPGPASLAGGGLDFAGFESKFLTAALLAQYLPEISSAETLTPVRYNALSDDERALIDLEIFYLVLRDSGRDRNDATKPTFGTYTAGFAAIDILLGTRTQMGNISTQARDIRTKNGGNINLLAPSGGLTLTTTNIGGSTTPPGVVTESGGTISVYTDANVDIGISRIFTLRGGDITIWSSNGDIAAGTSAKTVKSAPPTRVLIDPQSADVQTDLAGLATGGGIGVLATVANVAPGDVDLIAPTGVVDAGDAGIRSSGNLNIAAVAILNASNISVAGTSAGVPTVVAPVVNIAGIASASNTAAAGANAAGDVAKQNQQQSQAEELPSIISVEVLGYGG